VVVSRRGASCRGPPTFSGRRSGRPLRTPPCHSAPRRRRAQTTSTLRSAPTSPPPTDLAPRRPTPHPAGAVRSPRPPCEVRPPRHHRPTSQTGECASHSPGSLRSARLPCESVRVGVHPTAGRDCTPRRPTPHPLRRLRTPPAPCADHVSPATCARLVRDRPRRPGSALRTVREACEAPGSPCESVRVCVHPTAGRDCAPHRPAPRDCAPRHPTPHPLRRLRTPQAPCADHVRPAKCARLATTPDLADRGCASQSPGSLRSANSLCAGARPPRTVVLPRPQPRRTGAAVRPASAPTGPAPPARRRPSPRRTAG
jgi:hypothetical protein